MIAIELEGWREVEQMFKKLGEVGKKAFQQALTETVIEGVSKMREECPVQTNRLRSSIHFETPQKRVHNYKNRKGQSFSGKFNENLSGVSAAFGTNVDYADAANSRSSKPFFFEKAVSFAENKIEERLRVNYDKAVNELLR